MSEKSNSTELKSVKLPTAQHKDLKIRSANTGKSAIDLLSEAYEFTYKVDKAGKKVK